MSGGPSPVLNTAIGVPSRDSTTRDGASRSPGRSPARSGCRAGLPVPGAVAGRDRDEPVVLVERPRPRVDLEAVEVEAVGTALLGEVDQPAADASARSSRARRTAGRPSSSDRAISATTRPSSSVATHVSRLGSISVGEPAPDVVVGVAGGKSKVACHAASQTSPSAGPSSVAGSPDRHRGGPSGLASVRSHAVRHRRDSRLAAASSRIQVAPGARAPAGPGQRRGSRSGPRTSAMTAALSAPYATTRTCRATPMTAGLSVTRSTCGSMWVGAGIASASSVESNAAEPGKTDRRWPSRADPEQHEVEHRPAVGRLERPRRAARRRSVAAHQAAPSARADRLARRERVDVLDRDRHARDAAAGRALLGRRRCRAGCRRTA